MLLVERRLAIRQAQFDLALVPQGGSPTEPTAMKKMEMRKIISYATVMKIENKKCLKYIFCFILFFRS